MTRNTDSTDSSSDDAPDDESSADSSTEDTSNDRIAEIVASLTLPEKLELVHGAYDPDELATGYLPANERVGTPSMSMVDGPMGIRAVPSTAFPASIALAASWDPDLARELGTALAEEARGAGQDALLAPGFNIVRVPQCGRAFEYYSEDPHLASRLAVGTVDGIQSAGVMATAKHYLANNQEADRHRVSANVSERALREIYLPAFEAAVKEADVSSVMASYNRINGTPATENRRLLTEVLKDEWGFDGFVVSDWWSVMDGPAAAEAGLDLEMPGMPVYEWQCHGSWQFDVVDALPENDMLSKRRLGEIAERPWQPANPNPNVLDESHFDVPLRSAIESGDVDESVLDDKVRRILGEMDRFGLFDGEQPAGALDTPAHHDLAQRIAERGTVLLRNENDVLPLDGDESIAVVGPHADEPKVGGGGSSEVDPTRATSLLDGLRDGTSPTGTVTLARGVPRVGDGSMHDGLLPDIDALLGDEDPRIEDAMSAARGADVAVVVVRDAASEGEDRGLTLPGAQNELISAVSSVAERTVVVLNTAGMVTMPWVDDVDAVLQSWYPGQEDGNALANVLFGEVDPSGRLPVTIGERGADYPVSTTEQYPGINHEAEYSEGLYVGYRHFDERDVDPQFPFGYGLSYADFAYRDATVSDRGGAAVTVDVTVENVGDRDGRDVVQTYVSPQDPDVDRPVKELGAFAPVELAAGESTTVSLDLEERVFSYYDEAAGDWTVDGGAYDILVCRSSRDIRERVSVEV